MRPIHGTLVAVALVGALACRREQPDQPGHTEVTAGAMPVAPAPTSERPAPPPAADEGTAKPNDVAAMSPPPIGPKPRAPAQTTKHAQRPKAPSPPSHARRAPMTAKDAPGEQPTWILREEKIVTFGEPAEPKGKSTTPEAPTATPLEPREETPRAEPPIEPTAAGGAENHSTTLGDGKSGMYTGGQGTYGGRATWGTGGTSPTR